MNLIQRLFHFHDWEYFNGKDYTAQYLDRVCLKCGRYEHWTGEYGGAFWRQERDRNPQYWKTKEEIKADEMKQELRNERRRELTKKH